MSIRSINGESTEIALEELENHQQRLDGLAHSGIARVEFKSGQIAGMAGAISCDQDGQPLSQIDLAREVALVNEDLQSFGDGWANQIEVVEADLESVTRQCIEENYPAAREGLER